MKTCLFLLLAIFLVTAHADPRASADYSIAHEVADGGGGRSTSTDYTQQGSIGLAAGSVATATDLAARSGFTGQLFDVVGVNVSATPLTVDEGGTRQLQAAADLDDDTILDVAENDVTWSVVSGPVTGISAGGLATGGIVFENTAATVRGAYQGIQGDLGLTVLNVNGDDYLEYAGDGIDDDWQVAYFGAPPNASAAPGMNPDNDPHDNMFEFLAGFSPIDPNDFFQLTVQGFSAPGTLDLRLNKVIPNRTYTVEESPDLGLTIPFGTVGSPFSVGSEQLNHLFQDTGAAGARNFYHVIISRP